MKTQECPATKVCVVCEVEKPVAEFARQGKYIRNFCLDCKRAKNREHYNANKAAYIARAAEWADVNRERRREIVNAFDARNRERIRAYHAGRAEEVNAKRNAEYLSDTEMQERVRRKANEWYHANKHKLEVRADRARRCAERQRGLKQRTPAWADLEAIRKIYIQAQRLSDETGIHHNVDHRIPLFGKKVSGLHVETNLRVIPAKENRSKGNKLVEDIVSSASKGAGPGN